MAISYGYDALGRTTCVTNGISSIWIERSDPGQATNEIQFVGGVDFRVRREYDEARRLAQVASPENPYAMMYAYSTNGQLVGASNALASVAYRYAGDLRDAGYAVVLPNGTEFVHAVVRDRHRRYLSTLITNRVQNAAAEATSYGYDLLGRPIRRNDDSFVYDALGEVSSATIADHTAYYVYDRAGNQTASTELPGSIDWRANALNEYQGLAYDPDGNTLAVGAFSLAYDAENRLVSVRSNGVLRLENEYDGLGRRVVKRTPGSETTFFYDDWNLLEERCVSGSSTNVFRYYWGKDISGSFQGAGGIGGLLFFTRNDELFIPFCDANGNVVSVYDATGALAAAFTYDAYGRTVASTGPAVDSVHFRFSTKYYDPESDLYYYGYRFYSPYLARWLNRDPLEENGGENLFLFCGNNPLNKVDPDGRVQVELVTRKPATWIEQILNQGDIYSYQIVRELKDFGVETVKMNRAWGRIQRLNISNIDSCHVTLQTWIYLSDTLIDYVPISGKFGYVVHAQANDPLLPSGGQLTPKSGDPVPLGLVRAHEFGHAKAILETIFPIFKGSVLAKFSGKINSNSSDALEIEQLFAEALSMGKTEFAEQPNRTTIEWFRSNGFTFLKTGISYEFSK